MEDYDLNRCLHECVGEASRDEYENFTSEQKFIYDGMHWVYRYDQLCPMLNNVEIWINKAHTYLNKYGHRRDNSRYGTELLDFCRMFIKIREIYYYDLYSG